jgi:hypothetical protein
VTPITWFGCLRFRQRGKSSNLTHQYWASDKGQVKKNEPIVNLRYFCPSESYNIFLQFNPEMAWPESAMIEMTTVMWQCSMHAGECYCPECILIRQWIIDIFDIDMRKYLLTSIKRSACSFRSSSLSSKVAFARAAFMTACDSFDVRRRYDFEVSHRSSRGTKQMGHGQRLIIPRVSDMTDLVMVPLSN